MKHIALLFLLASCQLQFTGIEPTTNTSHFVDVSDLGITPSTTIPASNSIQDIVDGMNGGTLFFPMGTYILDTTIVITKAISIRGEGDLTIFRTINDTEAFKFQGTSSINRINDLLISDIKLKSDTVSTQAALRFLYTKSTTIDNVTITSYLAGVGMNESWSYTLRGCYINDFNMYGVRISNLDPLLIDDGDGFITGCAIGTTRPEAIAGISQINSGGLKIDNCKFNGGGGLNGPRFHYQYKGAGNTVDLLISNSSFENFARTAVSVDKGTASFFRDVVISGSQFAYGGGNYPTIEMKSIDGISVVGNVLRGIGSNTAISLTSCTNGRVSNTYVQHAANPVQLISCTGITVN